MPVRIAFIEDDIVFWVVIDWIVDALFLLDIFVNFFSAYFDQEDNLITNKKVISTENKLPK